MISRSVLGRPQALAASALMCLWLVALTTASVRAQVLATAGHPEIYAELDSGDATAAVDLMRRTLESELSWRVANWKSRATGFGGSITPVRTFRTTDGIFCREYRESVATTKRVVAELAVACRDPAVGWVRVGR